MDTDDYKTCVKLIYCWQYSYSNSFYDRLIDLFRSADARNRGKLKKVWPVLLYKALNDWENAEDNGNDLFREYGFLI